MPADELACLVNKKKAKTGAHQRAASPENTHTSNDHGGDDSQFNPHSNIRFGCIAAGHEKQSCQRRGEAGKGVKANQNAIDMDP